METVQTNLLEIEAQYQSKNHKKSNNFFIIFLIILLTIIICSITLILTLLKHHVDSQSISENPIEAIRSVCRITPDYLSCFESISSLHYQTNHSKTNIINPSDIIRLSIQADFEELSTIRSLPEELFMKFKHPKIEQAFANCKKSFYDSFAQLNKNYFLVQRNYEEILVDDQLIRSIKDSMIRAIDDIRTCLDGLENLKGTDWEFLKNVVKARVHMAKVYMWNSLAILEKLELIDEMFESRVLSILGSFMLGREYYVLTIGVFSLQYLVLLLLFCSLLRVFGARLRK